MSVCDPFLQSYAIIVTAVLRFINSPDHAILSSSTPIHVLYLTIKDKIVTLWDTRDMYEKYLFITQRCQSQSKRLSETIL